MKFSNHSQNKTTLYSRSYLLQKKETLQNLGNLDSKKQREKLLASLTMMSSAQQLGLVVLLRDLKRIKSWVSQDLQWCQKLIKIIEIFSNSGKSNPSITGSLLELLEENLELSQIVGQYRQQAMKNFAASMMDSATTSKPVICQSKGKKR